MNESRKKPGRWQPGQSGNPQGRKPGTGEVAKLRAAIAGRLPELLEAAIARALAGDMAAMRLLLDRSIAPLRPMEQTEPIDFPAGGTFTDQGRAVLAGVSAGTLTPGQGAQILAAIGALAKIAELDELERRLANLEARHVAP